MSDTNRIMATAKEKRVIIPAFNIPYLPMMSPTVQALVDTGAFGLIEVAYIEWLNFEVKSLEDVYTEYQTCKNARCTRLHLDHIPVISEVGVAVDYVEIISRAIEVGYESVMVDGSKVSLAENIAATRKIVEIAHKADIAVEGELGSILRLGSGPLPPYEELFASKQGFTDPEEAVKFVQATGVDWLSVSFGNIHGSISSVAKKDNKLAAKLDIEHLAKINRLLGIPLVLHGGSDIPKTYIHQSIQNGIAKINIGFVIRKAYEAVKAISITKAQEAVYDSVIGVIDELEIRGTADVLVPKN
jgi:fructose-bisphosphate aldolase class II